MDHTQASDAGVIRQEFRLFAARVNGMKESPTHPVRSRRSSALLGPLLLDPGQLGRTRDACRRRAGLCIGRKTGRGALARLRRDKWGRGLWADAGGRGGAGAPREPRIDRDVLIAGPVRSPLQPHGSGGSVQATKGVEFDIGRTLLTFATADFGSRRETTSRPGWRRASYLYSLCPNLRAPQKSTGIFFREKENQVRCSSGGRRESQRRKRSESSRTLRVLSWQTKKNSRCAVP